MQFVLTDEDLGELDLSPENGYVIESYDLGVPEVRESTYARTNDDGLVDYTTLHGGRTVTFQLTLDGNVDSPRRLRDRVAGFAHPRRRPLLTFTEPGDDRTRLMSLRGLSAPASVEHPKFGKMAVSFLCANGTIESSVERTMLLRPLDTSGEVGRVYPLRFARDFPPSPTAGARQLINDGNADAHWTATMYGRIVNPVLTMDGSRLSFTAGGGLTLSSGQPMTLASRGHRALINGATTALQYLNFVTSEWLRIPPGGCVVQLEASDFDADASLLLTWRDTWA